MPPLLSFGICFFLGLPPSGSWQDLKDHMREAGDVCYADVNRDGSGVVEYLKYDDMKYAIRKLDDTKFKSHEVNNWHSIIRTYCMPVKGQIPCLYCTHQSMSDMRLWPSSPLSIGLLCLFRVKLPTFVWLKMAVAAVVAAEADHQLTEVEAAVADPPAIAPRGTLNHHRLEETDPAADRLTRRHLCSKLFQQSWLGGRVRILVTNQEG